MNLYSQALDNYAVFKGRATRAEYWTFILLNNVIIYTLSLISFKMGWTSTNSSGTNEYAPLGVVFWLFILIPVISVSIRRIHDIGLSGWWGWLFIPLMLPMLIVALIPSKKDKTSKESRVSLSKAVTNNVDNTSLDDEILYEYVLLHEIEDDNKIKSTWAKALAHSDGIVTKAESLYMQYRVQAIKGQLNTLNITYDDMSKEDLFYKIQHGFNDPVTEQKNLEEKDKVEVEQNYEELEEEFKREENHVVGYVLLFGLLGFYLLSLYL